MVEITPAQLNQRLDNFLFKWLGKVPRTRIYRIIRKGEVRVNRKRCKPDYKLQLGDQVRIPPMRLDDDRERVGKPSSSLLALLEGSVLYQNRHILVIDKPAGVAVHAGSNIDYGVIDAMRILYPQEQVELVHRLDRDTSGCLLLSKNRQALLAMQSMLKSNALKKNYNAVVRGDWPPELGEVGFALSRFHLPNGERRVRVDSDGKKSLSRFRLLRGGNDFSFVQVELLTGRTHQIRVHCQASGHEIAGDEKYGDTDFNRRMRRLGVRRLMLHAGSLELPACEYWREQVVNAPLPTEFERLWAAN